MLMNWWLSGKLQATVEEINTKSEESETKIKIRT